MSPRAAGIIIVVAVALIVLSFSTCSITQTYFSGDLVKDEPGFSMRTIEEESVPALRSLTAVAPVTNTHRDALAQTAQALVQESRDTLAQYNAGLNQKKTRKELAHLHKKRLTQQLLLLTTATIVKDGKLTSAEYTAWVKLYQVRDKDDLRALKGFQDSFRMYKKNAGGHHAP